MRFRKIRSKQLSLDITPLIDVIFLLLIFFMISTTFISYNEIKIKLPVAVTKATEDHIKPLEVTITKNNRIFINSKLIDSKQLRKALENAKMEQKQNKLVIRADGQVRHENIVFVMDTAKLAGIEKLSIATILQR